MIKMRCQLEDNGPHTLILVVCAENVKRLRNGFGIRIQRVDHGVNLWDDASLGDIIMLYGGENQADLAKLGQRILVEGPRVLAGLIRNPEAH